MQQKWINIIFAAMVAYGVASYAATTLAESCADTVNAVIKSTPQLPSDLQKTLAELIAMQTTPGQPAQDDSQAAELLLKRQTMLQTVLAQIGQLQQQPSQEVENEEQLLLQLQKITESCQH